MWTAFKQRKIRKMAREWLHQAYHARCLREDVADPAALANLDRATDALRQVLKAGDTAAEPIHEGCRQVADAIRTLCPPKRFAWWRENLEIAMVAVAVAMAFRAYFIQPFKIPTGSMQPTLYGIHYSPQIAPSWVDRYPLNLARWLIFGEWYTEYTAQASGRVGDAYIREGEPGTIHVAIGGRNHALPRSLMEAYRFRPGDTVTRGQVLAAGVRTQGDHIFVNKVKWNIWPPRRGEVMVFTTREIEQIEPDTHYIKRMVGMPNEAIAIDPPRLLADESPVREPEMIRRISDQENGYAGYQLTGSDAGDHRYRLNTPGDRLNLGPDGYAAFGDNTRNSLDSRYWGAVPRQNLVGPAFWVYWPISARWGRIR